MKPKPQPDPIFEETCQITDHNADTDIYILHGFQSSQALEIFTDTPILKTDHNYNIIQCTARGHGKRKGNQWDWNGTLSDYEELMKKRKKKIIIIGRSMGAAEAVSLGLRHPEIEKIFAVSGLYDKDFVSKPPKKDQLRKRYHITPEDEQFMIENVIPALPESNNPCEIEIDCDDCKKINPKRFYLVHAKGDSLVEFEQFEHMRDQIGIPEENTLIFENPSRMKTYFGHILPSMDIRTSRFIEKHLEN